ncbi:GNAT family N-acetyltransferase [Tengunoibacter tsumagoiensis]|uniref:N-acetyltransferase domain-containing protein n=1 Tax=Tengunoibacter tsumagoiensis TaxID=2014871 RepID=A0A402A984_9CHLR|nr:GNAT family N-acetyltransferase [Tengunoibacter tsumagoiensis]GCE15744.1 hypothetical protein KTT_56030 [Tengunoibacter tsumagoiensis]
MAPSQISLPLRIEAYTSSQKEAVVRIFRDLTASFPYVAELTEALFEERVVHKFFFDPQGLLIGYRGDRALGLFHGTFAPPQSNDHELDKTRGNIRLLLFPPEDPGLGTALLEQGMSYLQAQGAREILGWSSFAGYPFYKGIYMGTEPVLSASLPHVIVRFVQKGFQLQQHSIFLGRPLDETVSAMNPDLELKDEPLHFGSPWQKESWDGLQPQHIHALIDGEQVGQLIWVLLPDLQSKRGCLVGSIASLSVDERFQRRGIGKALVGAALSRMYASGAREAIVATTQDNTAALHTYYTWGFAEKELLLGYSYRA